jgi:hypothetical protein
MTGSRSGRRIRRSALRGTQIHDQEPIRADVVLIIVRDGGLDTPPAVARLGESLATARMKGLKHEHLKAPGACPGSHELPVDGRAGSHRRDDGVGHARPHRTAVPPRAQPRGGQRRHAEGSDPERPHDVAADPHGRVADRRGRRARLRAPTIACSICVGWVWSSRSTIVGCPRNWGCWSIRSSLTSWTSTRCRG